MKAIRGRLFPDASCITGKSMKRIRVRLFPDASCIKEKAKP